eukprot:TRINITY_DN2932_c1_g1_i2.p1 TRINITY_DN2932_c1_g1~~TRINITY_DN2932_c1_g1_i2.p1  ORF type:complete len:713 (+),score=135.40 TRINITY_DN2932_c1_g1_i2:416-2554(+)
MWVSVDGAKTFKVLRNIPAAAKRLVIHKITPSHIIIVTQASSTAPIEAWVGTGLDGDEPVWKKINGIDSLNTIYSIDWNPFPNSNPNRVYAVVRNHTEKVHIYGSRIIIADLDSSITWVPLDNVYNSRWIGTDSNKWAVVTCASSTLCDEKELHISLDGGRTFKRALFPDVKGTEEMDEKDYSIYEFTENSIFIHVMRRCDGNTNNVSNYWVNYNSENVCWGDLFHSTSSSFDFTLSLSYQKYGGFSKYRSVEGIYISNQYKASSSVQQESSLQSLISFNKGSSWSVIRAPVFDALNQPTNCDIKDGCSLHLHGMKSYSADISSYMYSADNAIGLMIATGNLGKEMITSESEINTYYSIDGGIEWYEIKKGSWFAEIGDHGSLILLAPQKGSTNSVVYSINSGDEWNDCTLINGGFDIDYVRIPRKRNTSHILMVGTRNVSSTVNAVILHMDFDSTYDKQCKLADGDFETWSPKDTNGHCVMGNMTTYNLRKYGRSCYYGSDYNPIDNVTTTPCVCSIEDYECSPCFYRPTLESPCVYECLLPDEHAIDPPSPSQCSTPDVTYYLINSGYRKIEGDTCITNTSLQLYGQVPCSLYNKTKNGVKSASIADIATMGFALTVIIGVFVSGVLVYFWKNSITFHNYIHHKFGIGEELFEGQNHNGEVAAFIDEQEDEDDDDEEKNHTLGVLRKDHDDDEDVDEQLRKDEEITFDDD